MTKRNQPGALARHRAGATVLEGTSSDIALIPEPQPRAEAAGMKTDIKAETPPVKICRCRYCGQEFISRRSSARYCSEAHKKAYQRSGLAGQNLQQKGLQVLPHLTAPTAHFSSSQAVENARGDVSLISILKKIPPDPPEGLRFEKVNEVTIKLTDGVQERTPGSHGQWAGFNVSRSLAVLTDIGGGRWIVGSGGQSLGPCPLHIAKRAAIALATGAIKGTSRRNDPIGWLNRLSAGATTEFEELLEVEDDA